MDKSFEHLAPHERFREHCQRRGLSQKKVSEELTAWAKMWVPANLEEAKACVPSERQAGTAHRALEIAEKLARNMSLFINGKSGKLSTNLVGPVHAFCKHLGLPISEGEFEGRSHTDYLAQFAGANAARDGLLESLCDEEYHLFRPGVEEAGLTPIVNGKLGSHPLKIYADGSNRYSFEFRNLETGQNWAGHALARERYIYLVGFDQLDHEDVMSLILTPKNHTDRRNGPSRDGGVLIGGVFMRVVDALKNGDEHEMAVGRIAAAARRGPRFEEYKTEALKWLGNMQDATEIVGGRKVGDRVGFVADLKINKRRRGS